MLEMSAAEAEALRALPHCDRLGGAVTLRPMKTSNRLSCRLNGGSSHDNSLSQPAPSLGSIWAALPGRGRNPGSAQNKFIKSSSFCFRESICCALVGVSSQHGYVQEGTGDLGK